MLHPKNIQSHAYTYVLPEENIARFPLANRDQSKLLICKNNRLQEDIYANISEHLPGGCLLVFNNTKVINARILFKKQSGGVVEIFTLEPEEEQGYARMTERSTGSMRWKCLVGGAGKWKHGQIMQKQCTINGEEVTLSAQITARLTECFVVEFNWQPVQYSFLQLLEKAGSVPVPPYLKREAAINDQERYQTIYAQQEGSVAAPTAGLHFTEQVFRSLAEKKIDTAYITLHVGAGTFMPVKSSTLEGHAMHAELIEAEAGFIQALIDHRKQVVAVGTTSLRTLESLYWMGVKCVLEPNIPAGQLAVQQWDAYDMAPEQATDTQTALQALLRWMHKNKLEKLTTRTRLLIAPPYRGRVATGLITNFHQPASTLLLLVAALIGDRWKEMYDYALRHGYRFLSYGDGCLIWFG